MSNPKQLTFPWNRSFQSSFKGFYIDPQNKQLISILKNIPINENIYIYGLKNSGKTYLLQSLCNEYSKNNKSSLFLPLMDVTKYGVEIIDSIENMDLVCIDGLEAVSQNKEWEIGLFNLINNAQQTGCRLVFTSSSEEGAINFSLADLDSRIRKFQSHEIFPISDDHLLKALKKITNLRSISLGEKEAQYLITYTKRNIADLTIILESLDQLSMENKRRITIPLIKELL
jgi:DnaA-homolog protein